MTDRLRDGYRAATFGPYFCFSAGSHRHTRVSPKTACIVYSLVAFQISPNLCAYLLRIIFSMPTHFLLVLNSRDSFLLFFFFTKVHPVYKFTISILSKVNTQEQLLTWSGMGSSGLFVLVISYIKSASTTNRGYNTSKRDFSECKRSHRKKHTHTHKKMRTHIHTDTQRKKHTRTQAGEHIQ